ncbi:glycosyltransferase [Sphingobium phenoxybenzoativorans]|uniref:Glycosyltransferase n=1 Tax=Sphingobium phenoxybenzoativorans TaxID=1592790 RepID=A0A975K6H1_9SPHN|nr:glycosyltransferase [Sphingobium phenoxybenzoativorans]QUT05669.1 glycosyltransferase [Sphingobium phenoxybenzoativorans]
MDLHGRPLVIAHVQTRMTKGGGAEENVWASCVHQANSGHTVHLFAGSESDIAFYKGLSGNIQVHLVPSMIRALSPKADYAAYREMAQMFETVRPDIVHTHTSKAGIVGRLAAKKAGVPAIIHGVHILPFSNTGLLQKLIYLSAEHAVAPITDHFIHVSRGTREAYRRAMVGRRATHSVVRSGMMIEKFRGAAWPDDWQAILGVSDRDQKPPTILMMAALEARKRHTQFITAFANATVKGENIRLLLGGEGPMHATLARLIEELEVGDRVKLLGYRKDPECLVAMADVGVLASLREGLPRVVVQYLAGGIPAVVSPLEGIAEIVDPDFNGIIAATDDAGLVAEEAVRLVRDPVLLERLTGGVKAAAVDEWTFESMYRQIDDSYSVALERPAVKRRLSRVERREGVAATDPSIDALQG